MKSISKLLVAIVLISVLVVTSSVFAQSSGGTLTLGLAVEPISLDPAGSLYIPEQFLIQQIYDPLVAVDPDQNYHPALAESWEMNADGTEFTFKLRQGVKFHDGTDFNAAAVKVNLDRAALGTTPAAASPAALVEYLETEVVDDYTAVVKFSSPQATFIQNLTRPWLMMASPAAIEKYGVDFGQHPVGTGPFMFKEWAAQDHITLEKNPDYNWGAEFYTHTGPALLDEVNFRIMPEAAIRLTAVQTGEALLVQDPSALETSQMKADGSMQVFVFVAPGMTSHQMINSEKEPTNDLNVRKAMIYAVDQDTIVQTGFYGLVPAAHSVISPSTWAFSEEANDLYRYDPEKAKSLLEEAGWTDSDGDGIREKDGVKLHLEYTALPAYEEAFMELLAFYLTEVGFEVNIIKLDDAGIIDYGAKGLHSMLNMSWISRDPSVLAYVYDSANIDGGNESAYTRFRNDRLDEILRTAPQELDEEKRNAMYQEAQMIIMENAIALPIYSMSNTYVADPSVAGFRFDPEGYPYLYEISIVSD